MKLSRLTPYLVYPTVIALGYIAYFSLNLFIPNHLFNVSIAIGFMGFYVYLLEFFFPFRRDWVPQGSEIFVDIFLYNLLIQVAFPLTLILASIFIFKTESNPSGQMFSVWPVHLPFMYQFLIFILTGEFIFYWWHRYGHINRWTSPIHMIHHIPIKLYSLNTVRFHLLDKFFEYFFCVFIFFHLGMPLEIIYVYYIFFTGTGLIQHCNLNVKFGVFDYLISSGETHRLHHDKDIIKSRCNYANNIVVWDIVFGSFRRDSGFCPKEIGIKKLSQIGFAAEFILPFKILSKMVFKRIIHLRMLFVKMRYFNPIIKKTNSPMQAQNKLLEFIIKKNASTLFGKKHFFSQIKNRDEYRKSVPIKDFEYFRPYIESNLASDTNQLTLDNPIYFNKTSGTTGVPKYLPLTQEALVDYQKIQKLISYCVFKEIEESFDGFIFSVVGRVEEELVAGKFQAGSMSGKSSSETPSYVKKKYVVDDYISNLDNLDLRNLYLASLCLLVPDVTVYISPNPSTFLKIIETINQRRSEIKKIILSNDQVFLKFKKNIPHAIDLLSTTQDISACDFWKNLKGVIMWTGGSCSYLIPKIKEKIPLNTKIFELGYLSSEFHGTVNIDSDKGWQLPTFDINFFEFIEKEKYETGERSTLFLDEVEEGKEYYVIVTTKTGLYRYFINDIVKINGLINKTPSFVFVRKGKGMTSITGEKISEDQIVNFFKEFKEIEGKVAFFKCLASVENQEYYLYIENNSSTEFFSLKQLEEEFNNYLKENNIEFKSKVESGRLKKIRCYQLKQGTADVYREFQIKRGQRESQLKFLYLQYDYEESFNFKNHLIGNNE